jgi:hypothetical protein
MLSTEFISTFATLVRYDESIEPEDLLVPYLSKSDSISLDFTRFNPISLAFHLTLSRRSNGRSIKKLFSPYFYPFNLPEKVSAPHASIVIRNYCNSLNITNVQIVLLLISLDTLFVFCIVWTHQDAFATLMTRWTIAVCQRTQLPCAL